MRLHPPEASSTRAHLFEEFEDDYLKLCKELRSTLSQLATEAGNLAHWIDHAAEVESHHKYRVVDELTGAADSFSRRTDDVRSIASDLDGIARQYERFKQG